MTDITIANASTMKKKPHTVHRMRIKYKSGLKGERYIEPNTKEQVTFEHLDDAGYMTLISMNVIKQNNTGGK